MGTERSTLPDASANRSASNRSSIADLVFAGEPGGGGRRLLVGGAMVLGLYAVAFGLIGGLGQSAAPWSAEMAARVHDAIAVERAVDVTPPPPPPAPWPEPLTAEAKPPPRAARSPVARAKPAAPAQAGQLAAASPAPLDFSGSAFIVGTGSSYAGGKTTSAGTGRKAATGNIAAGGTGTGAATARSRARPVALDQSAWSCPWPAEADARQVDEETVVLQAAVSRDGRVEHVDVVSDPGFGFGAAARVCALATRFEPARDAAGQATAALSPPIRVHFFR